MHLRARVLRYLRRAVLALAAFCAAAPLVAQLNCNLVPGTGCAGIGPSLCASRVGIGQTIGGLCSFGGGYLLLLGACAPSPIPVPGCCSIGVDPVGMIVMHVHGPWNVPVPFDPRLIGVVLCYQCFEEPACRSPSSSLMAVRVTITP